MDQKSATTRAFYTATGRLDDGSETFASNPSTAGPWSAAAQHGGPPSALLTRAVEHLPVAADRVVGRIAVDLLGPVPVGPLATTARVLRAGRTVCLVEAELVALEAARPVARATAWLFPSTEPGAGMPEVSTPALTHGPDDGFDLERPPTWLGGYLDAVEWRWIEGTLDRPGPGVVWMRPPQLVEGEETSAVQRLMACVDSASGVSSCLDVREWSFVNTELTVHVLRAPVGEWVCLDATTHLAGAAVGVCTSGVHDPGGLVARSAQALLVARRPG
jgi:hypothetical protein